MWHSNPHIKELDLDQSVALMASHHPSIPLQSPTVLITQLSGRNCEHPHLYFITYEALSHILSLPSVPSKMSEVARAIATSEIREGLVDGSVGKALTTQA